MEASFNYVTVGEDEIYTATIRDITQRKETEAELNRAQAEIRRRLELELEDAKVVQKALLPPAGSRARSRAARLRATTRRASGDRRRLVRHSLPARGAVRDALHGRRHRPRAAVGAAAPAWSAARSYSCGVHPRHPPGRETRLAAEKQLRNMADVVNRDRPPDRQGRAAHDHGVRPRQPEERADDVPQRGHNMPYLVKGRGASPTPVSNLIRAARASGRAQAGVRGDHPKLDPGDVVCALHGRPRREPGAGRQGVLGARHEAACSPQEESATEIRDELVARAKASGATPAGRRSLDPRLPLDAAERLRKRSAQNVSQNV